MKQKLKTKKAAAKRFKITGSGKVMRGQVGKRHLLEHKAQGSKRQKRDALVVDSTNLGAIKDMLPGVL